VASIINKVDGMSIDRTRAFLLSLPRVEETLQWDRLVYWVLDKAVGGKMFAMVEPEPGGRQVIAFATPPDRYPELLEIEGIQPAPYLARAHWIAVEDWGIFPERELKAHLKAAYERVEAKLPSRVQRHFELKDREYRALVREKRAALKVAGENKRG
jgi:predicted DNA-binding protein (MmcQ/YjbR family)